jgi:hypothetical protein
LCVQVSHIVENALGTTDEFYRYNSIQIYQFISKEVAHEHGRDALTGDRYAAHHANVHTCIRAKPDLNVWLDCVELSLWPIETYRGNFDKINRSAAKITIPASKAIEEVNERFRRAGFGYRYAGRKIIRVDSELVHQEVTLPALQLLSDPRFKGADDEFRAAHDHYKAGEYKDCAVDALNALESTMKIVRDLKGWAFQHGARSSDLSRC